MSETTIIEYKRDRTVNQYVVSGPPEPVPAPTFDQVIDLIYEIVSKEPLPTKEEIKQIWLDPTVKRG